MEGIVSCDARMSCPLDSQPFSVELPFEFLNV